MSATQPGTTKNGRRRRSGALARPPKGGYPISEPTHHLLLLEEEERYIAAPGEARSKRKTVTVRRPGQPGTKKLWERYGKQLVCVRYIEDAKGRKRYKTVELVVSIEDWTPPPPRIERRPLVGLHIHPYETLLQKQVKAAGGKWDAKRFLWKLPRKIALALKLRARIVELDGFDKMSPRNVPADSTK